LPNKSGCGYLSYILYAGEQGMFMENRENVFLSGIKTALKFFEGRAWVKYWKEFY